MSPSFDTYGMFFIIVFAFGSAIAFYKREALKKIVSTKALPPNTFKKLSTFLVVYVLLMYPLFKIAQASIYPGIVVKLWAEIRPSDASSTGEEFKFTSTLDGATLGAYHQM